MNSANINELQKLMRKAIRAGDDHEFFRLLDDNPEQLAASTVFGTWLHVAADYGRIEIVKFLKEKGMDINIRDGVAEGTPLNLAASGGHDDIVDFLLMNDAFLDTDDPVRNPLFGAIYKGSPTIVRKLLNAGIDSRVSYTGESMKDMDAIAFAEERGELEIASLIREFQRLNP